jgi:hypothetical protein
MHNAWSVANYKVGISKSPGRRQAEVTFAYEVEPVIKETVWFTSDSGAKQAERAWHKYLADLQTDDHGGKEWFSLSNNELQLFYDWAALSSTVEDLRYWLHQVGASRHEQDNYNHSLISKIPRKTIYHPSIELWTRDGSNDNLNWKMSTSERGIKKQYDVISRTSRGTMVATPL